MAHMKYALSHLVPQHEALLKGWRVVARIPSGWCCVCDGYSPLAWKCCPCSGTPLISSKDREQTTSEVH